MENVRSIFSLSFIVSLHSFAIPFATHKKTRRFFPLIIAMRVSVAETRVYNSPVLYNWLFGNVIISGTV